MAALWMATWDPAMALPRKRKERKKDAEPEMKQTLYPRHKGAKVAGREEKGGERRQ